MTSRLLSGALVSIVGAISLWGCGGGGGGGGSTPTAPTAPPQGPTTVTVSVVGSIGNRAYSPNPVQAAVGDTVVFRNSDTNMHHIVTDDASSDLGDLMPGSTSRGLTVRNGSALAFHCTIHPAMVGTINGAVAPDPPCIDSYGYACSRLVARLLARDPGRAIGGLSADSEPTAPQSFIPPPNPTESA